MVGKKATIYLESDRWRHQDTRCEFRPALVRGDRGRSAGTWAITRPL